MGLIDSADGEHVHAPSQPPVTTHEIILRTYRAGNVKRY